MAKVRGDCEIECEKAIRAKAKEEIEAESQKRITLKAPLIELKGILAVSDPEGNFTEGSVRGNFHIIEGDVSAESVSLRKHQHEYSGCSGIGGKPVVG